MFIEFPIVRWLRKGCLAGLGATIAVGCASAGSLPEALSRGDYQLTRAFHDGAHNAFTGSAGWGAGAVTVFRHGNSHLTFDGEVVVLQTEDGKEFVELARLKSPGKDLRDPKVLNVDGRLYLYCGSVDGADPSRNIKESLVYTSDDGATFTPHAVEGLLPGSWLWHVVCAPGGNFYGSAYRTIPGTDYTQATIYRSPDGIHWTALYPVPILNSNEVWLDVDPETGALYGLVRQEEPPFNPYLMTIRNPLDPGVIDLKRLPITLQGPFLKRVPEGFVILGRSWEKSDPKTRLWAFLLTDDDSIRKLGELPSGNDCSYAAWAQLADGTQFISYYSGHLYPAAEHKTDLFVATIAE